MKEQYEEVSNTKKNKKGHPKKKKRNKFLRSMLLICLVLFFILIGLLVSRPGRSFVYGLIADYVSKTVNNSGIDLDGDGLVDMTFEGLTHTANPNARKEDYVTNILLMGIESINGGSRTDSMMIASINTKDNSIKLTSLLRDMYVEIPGYKGNKLNAAYAKGGAQMLVDAIEYNFDIYIDAYASVGFESLEKIVDLLGGVEIELGKKEAAYLRKTNYISNPKYRTVQEGVQRLNGNQVVGYCRVRKVETLGGANSDYGRTLRQRRVLKSIFEEYKSKNVFQLVSIMNQCLKYVNTNMTSTQIQKAIEDIAENGIMTLDSERIPVNGSFSEEKNYKGAGWVLVPNLEKNIQELHEFIYLDGQEQTSTEEKTAEKK